jgi:hypothetical protein
VFVQLGKELGRLLPPNCNFAMQEGWPTCAKLQWYFHGPFA